jgi:hypothetical protein
MKKLPNTITVTIQEIDRQCAGHFQYGSGCLIATALKRMGYNHDTPISVCLDYVEIGGIRYNPNKSIGIRALHAINGRDQSNMLADGIHYREGVVGKVIKLQKEVKV